MISEKGHRLRSHIHHIVQVKELLIKDIVYHLQNVFFFFLLFSYRLKWNSNLQLDRLSEAGPVKSLHLKVRGKYSCQQTDSKRGKTNKKAGSIEQLEHEQ